MNAITLVNVALQGLLLSAIGWALVRWCIQDARHRAWASLLVLLVALLAPLLMELHGKIAVIALEEAPSAPVASWKPDWKIPTSIAAPASNSSESVIEVPNATSAAATWTHAGSAWWACALWIAGTILVAALLAVMSLAAWRWRRALRTLTATETDLLPSSASRYALRVSEGEGSPCVVGLWQPVIAVPHRIIGKWSSRQWTWLLRHEGEHVQGRDTLTAWLLGWTKALVWWNPFVHALVEQWSQAREEICDMAAVSGEGDPAAYSDFLLDIAAGNRMASPAMMHMAASRPARKLRARMEAILARRRVRERASQVFQIGALAVMGSFAAIVSCVGLKAEDAPAKAIAKAEKTPSNDSTQMYTRTYSVRHDFFPKNTWDATTTDLLRDRGITFPEGAYVHFIRATDQLVVKNTVVNLDRVAEVLNPRPAQEVKFVTGEKRLAPGDDIVIDKVFCTSPNFTIGDRVVVKGHYKLASETSARLSLFLTSSEGGREPVSYEQRAMITQGTGAFELAQTIQHEGVLHVSLYPAKGGSDLGGVYFGTQEQVKLSNTFSHKVDQGGGPAAPRTHGQREPSETVKEVPSNGVPPKEVKFVVGRKQFAKGDEIVIDKVLCGSDEFKPGDKVVVQGHYKLASIPEARLALSLSSFANGGRGRWQIKQYGDVQRGSGTFEREEDIQFDGSLHVSFYDMTGGKSIGGIYFGTQQQVDQP